MQLFFQDHTYALQNSPAELKKRILEMERKLDQMRSKLCNVRKREKRAKTNLDSLLEDMKKQKLLTSECEEKLEFFKGSVPKSLHR
jgi:predicted  nucleic acid-binding Zn-ribbon protein